MTALDKLLSEYDAEACMAHELGLVADARRELEAMREALQWIAAMSISGRDPFALELPKLLGDKARAALSGEVIERAK